MSERQIKAAVEWVAVEGPRSCRCGHEHYGRTTSALVAPQWSFCEDVECSCRCLRPLEETP